jgi:hypothetical protein
VVAVFLYSAVTDQERFQELCGAEVAGSSSEDRRAGPFNSA